ncbi:MAG: agmatinase [Spirochaetales bacterium]|nr:agmatinase [Spirochaetales bacterium]
METTYPIFLGSEFEQGKESHSLFHVLSVPYEATVSYGGGTSKGPRAILDASYQLEAYDGLGFPGEDGFFTYPPIDCSRPREEVFAHITTDVRGVLQRPHVFSTIEGSIPDYRKIPVILGGEHSITYPILQAFVAEFGAEKIGVVQFDAHADLRDAYEGSPFSHASVMRRIHQDLGVQIFQLGVRALCPEEIFYRQDKGVLSIDARDLVPTLLREVPLPEDFPPYVFITFDLDGLDPSIMPATGTPVPGGIGWYQALDLVASVTRQRRVVGFDVVELAPLSSVLPGFVAPEFLAADLTHKIMGSVSRSLQAKFF